MPRTCRHICGLNYFKVFFCQHLQLLVAILPLTHLQCTSWARLGWQVPLVSCLSREFVSAESVMVFLPPQMIDLCGIKEVSVHIFLMLTMCVCVCEIESLYSVWACRRLLLSLSRLMSRPRSCCRNPGLGQMSLCGLTATTASRSVKPSTIIRKASTKVAERLTPIRQWTNTRPGKGTIDIQSTI